ncbi:MAG: hypothetical protein HOW97_22050 [Catenulispora sp.]|nr:hypothetical protein [Catenulispora sp.]
MPELIPRLMTPFLPVETRYRLRQHKIDDEAAGKAARVLASPGVSVTVRRSTTGAGSWREARLVPVPSVGHTGAWWYTKGGLAWDGTVLTVTGSLKATGSWRTAQGGVKPGFGAAEVAQAGVRPPGSGECPSTVVEIAAVGIGDLPVRRLYFLDEESRHLTMTPFRGFTDAKLSEFVQHAGVVFRTYSLTTGGATTPDAMCEFLFPRSARRRLVISENSELADWGWRGWP